MTGYLITLEGIDGSGKSTVAEALSPSDFEALARDVTFTREPTGSDAGQLLRENLSQDHRDPWTELFLFMADHSTHLQETVWPALEREELVICDRYIDSRCAYQGHTLDDMMDDPIQFLHNLHQPWSRFPDCTILLDIDPATAVERTTSGEKYEVEERLVEIQENYEELVAMDPDRFVRVDAEQSPEAVRDDVVSAIAERVPVAEA